MKFIGHERLKCNSIHNRSRTQQDDKEALAELPPAAQALDAELGGAITSLIAGETFKGAAKASASAIIGGGGSVKRVGVVGLGKARDLKTAGYEAVGAALAGLAKGAKVESAALVLPEDASGAEVAKVCVVLQPIMMTSAGDLYFMGGRCILIKRLSMYVRVCVRWPRYVRGGKGMARALTDRAGDLHLNGGCCISFKALSMYV